ncbi:MAG: tRNA (cytidine(34)-2'-O)-methyltransferase [Quisquiliibacterium sp.]
MFNVVLVHPEIPPNTGNVIRLCANAGASLHLIEPLGFPIDHAKMRRAGLDYREFAEIQVHPNWGAYRESTEGGRLFALTTRGTRWPSQVAFKPGDSFVFGSEGAGLATQLLADFAPEMRLRLPMRAGMRSMNLSNAVAVVVYEAWRQNGFAGAS